MNLQPPAHLTSGCQLRRAGPGEGRRRARTCAADRPQMIPDGAERGCRSISGVDNMASFLGRRDRLAGGPWLDLGRRQIPADPRSGSQNVRPLAGCKVTPPIANYRQGASIRSRGSKLHGSTTTRATCPGVICQTNYLSWACNCSENRYSGNCVVSCNVK